MWLLTYKVKLDTSITAHATRLDAELEMAHCILEHTIDHTEPKDRKKLLELIKDGDLEGALKFWSEIQEAWGGDLWLEIKEHDIVANPTLTEIMARARGELENLET